MATPPGPLAVLPHSLPGNGNSPRNMGRETREGWEGQCPSTLNLERKPTPPEGRTGLGGAAPPGGKAPSSRPPRHHLDCPGGHSLASLHKALWCAPGFSDLVTILEYFRLVISCHRASILHLTSAKNNNYIGLKQEKGATDGMASPTQWTGVSANSSRQEGQEARRVAVRGGGRTVGHNSVTGQQRSSPENDL